MAGERRRPSERINRLTAGQSVFLADLARSLRPRFVAEKTTLSAATDLVNAELRKRAAKFGITRANMAKLLRSEGDGLPPTLEPWDGLHVRESTEFAKKHERERAHSRIDVLEEKIAELGKAIAQLSDKLSGSADVKQASATMAAQATKLAEMKTQLEGLASLVQMQAAELHRLRTMATAVASGGNGSQPVRT
jgi:chromosome segregation ATPase